MRSVVMEEKTRLACQLEKKTLQVENLKKTMTLLEKNWNKTKDENSCLQHELTFEKTRKAAQGD